MLLRRTFSGLVTSSILLACSPPLDAQDTERSLGWNCAAIQTPSRTDQIQAPVITGISLQPSGKFVAIVGDDHIVSLYDLSQQKFAKHLVRHRDWVRSARFSPDGKRLATAGNDGKIILWNMENLGAATSLAVHPEAIIKVAFNHDGTKLAAVGFERKLRVYDVATGNLELTLSCPCSDMHAVAFAKDGSLIAAGGRSGEIQVWNASGQAVTKYKEHRQRVRSIEFTDDKKIVSVGDDCIVKITDLENQNMAGGLPRHGGKLFDVKVIQNNQLATCGSDNRIYLWDLSKMEKIGILKGHKGTVSCLDSHHSKIVSGSFDTQFRVWDAERSASIQSLPNFPSVNSKSPWNKQIK